MKKINHALIMAAGRGTRMRPLTDIIPKAMAPYSGTTLIAAGIDKVKKYIKNIHITVGYKGAMLASHVIEHGVSSIFNTEGKGNAWWLYNTPMKYIDEPIVVLTCDNVVDMDFCHYYDDYLFNGAPACMVVPVNPVVGLEGDYIITDSERNVTEITRDKTSDFYCSGIQILNPFKINSLTTPKENFIDVWRDLIQCQQLKSSEKIPERWYAVDNLTQLDAINAEN